MMIKLAQGFNTVTTLIIPLFCICFIIIDVSYIVLRIAVYVIITV